MKNRDKIISIILVIILLYIVANLGSINSFLTFSTDKTIQLNHTQIVVPEAWNTTKELNMTEKTKTPDSITNNYVIWEVWEDWPEDHITELSESKYKSMESGGYEIINKSTVELGGVNVSKEYFYNPSRDSDTQWDCMGVNYVFPKEDTNYSVQIHYFTKTDYNNSSYTKELDDRFEDFMANIHNQNYDGFFSSINKIIQYVQKNI